MKNISLNIISPEETLFESEVKSFIVSGGNDSLGVLKNHAPLICLLKKGNVIITKINGEKEEVPINSGFLNLKDNQAIIIVD